MGYGAAEYSENLDQLLERLGQANMSPHMSPMGDLLEDVNDGHLRRQHAVEFALDVCVRKRQQSVVLQLHKVEQRIEQVRAAKREIESETVAEVQAILDRLNAVEMHKLCCLQMDSDVLKRDIEATHSFAKQTTSACQNCSAQQLMQVYDGLLGSCRRLADMPLKEEISVQADGFPREAQLKTLRAQKYEEVDQLQAASEQQQKGLQAAVAQIESDLSEQQAIVQSQQIEMHEWVTLSNKYHDELRNFLMRCTHCGEILTPDIINGDCHGVMRQGTVEEQWRLRQQGQRHHFVSIDECI